MKTNINVIIILPHVEAITYGIGSYISNLEKGVNGLPVCLHIIKTQMKNVDEFTINPINNNIVYVEVPFPKKIINGYSLNPMSLYTENVSILLYGYLKNLSNCVFQVNFSSALPYVDFLKRYFNYPVINVVHFASWHFQLKGNVVLFEKILKKRFSRKGTDSESQNIIINTFYKDREQFKKAEMTVVITDDMQQILKQYYKIKDNKINLIRNGISLIKPKTDSTVLIRKRMHIKQNEKIILFAGRITEDKGVIALINAFRLTLNTEINVRLILAGNVDFNAFAPLCKDIWSKVTFTGYLDQRDLYNLYSISTIAVVPSFYEQCPYSALEMMLFGLPVISSNAVGLNEIFKDYYNGLIVKTDIDTSGRINIDPKMLNEKILLLLSNPSLAKEIKKNARKTLLENHNAIGMARQMYKVYENIISN